MEEYAEDLDTGLALHRLVPVLLVPDNCIGRVQSWLPDDQEDASVSALLGSYQFFTDNVAHPQWLSTTVRHEFAVSVAE